MGIEISDEKFKEVRHQAEILYKKIGAINCPYLGRTVHFSTVGFQHILFKDWNTTRNRVEQYTRLKLIPLARRVIEKSNTLQEYDRRPLWVRLKMRGTWQRQLRSVQYYGFVAVFPEKEVRVKVIVKEIQGETPIFYSIYPSWRVEVGQKGERYKRLYTGDLEVE